MNATALNAKFHPIHVNQDPIVYLAILIKPTNPETLQKHEFTPYLCVI